MKNKKIVIALFAFAVILLGGMTAGMLQGMFPEEDTYKVVIRYNVVDGNGESDLYTTYSEKHVEGELINIVSPKIEGYKPDKEKVSAIVNSDLFVTVNYTCAGHIFEEADDVVLKYPTSESVGILQHTCTVCNAFYTEQFTTLSRTIVFGGDVVERITRTDMIADNYILKGDNIMLFILFKEGVPEWDIILNGVDIDTTYGIGVGATVTIDYDKEAWNNATIGFKQGDYDRIDTDYSIRIAKNWRINFGFEARLDGNVVDFILSDDCPLKTAPLTITLTYDYTK